MAADAHLRPGQPPGKAAHTQTTPRTQDGFQLAKFQVPVLSSVGLQNAERFLFNVYKSF